MSKPLKPQSNHDSMHGNTMKHKAAEKSLPADFLSYDSIWEMTDGSSMESDAAMLENMKNQYEGALRKSKEIVMKAQAEAARIEQEAYQKGFAQGQHDGEQAVVQKIDHVVQEFTALFHALQQKTLDIDQQYQEHILDLIKVMVERLVDHEISVSQDVIRSCLKNALEFVVDNAKLKIRLNPKDYNNITEFGLKVPGLMEGDSKVRFIADETISIGGCLISTDYGEVDATIETRREILFATVEQVFASLLHDEQSENTIDLDDSLL